MSELVSLNVEVRETFGKRRVRRMRADGFVPANLYGHGQEPVSLSIPVDAIANVVRQGHKLLNLTGGAQSEVLIKEVQWDVWGKEILHVDFARVDANERLTVTVPVVLKGDAVGRREGGVVEQHLHEIEIECSALNMPEHIIVRVNDLALNAAITLADVALPEGVTTELPAETVIVSCNPKKEVEEVAEGEAAAAEPEVIGKKKAEEEEEEKK